MCAAIAKVFPKSPGKGNEIEMSLEDPGVLESKVTSKHIIESETAKVPSCSDRNGSANDDNHSTEVNKLGKAMSTLPTSPQEATRDASNSRTGSQLLEIVEDLEVSEQSCANSKFADADIASRPFDPGFSVSLINTSTAAVLRENNTGNVGEHGEGANSGCTEVPNGLEQTDQQPESSDKNTNHGLKIGPEGLDDPPALSQPPDVCHDIVFESNTGFSHDAAEVAVSPIASDAYEVATSPIANDAYEVAVSPVANNAYLRNNVSDCEPENPGSHRIMGPSEVKLVDFSAHQLPSQETGITVVSTNVDGWQCFDVEEDKVNGAFGCEQTIDGGSQQKLELWEQLLEDGVAGSENHFQISTSQVEADVNIVSSLHDGNQFWLASPGNPFIEGLDRLSNFSEADGFIVNENMARSQMLHRLEANDSLPPQEAPSREGLFHSDHSTKDFLPGVIYDRDNLVEENLTSQSNTTCDNGSKQHAQPRFPSFSDIRRSSSKSRDPSIESFMEQVPPFQLSNNVHGFENGGEKWEANFDLMVSAMHEGPRSLSLPREAGDLQGQGETQSFSLHSREALDMPQSKPSGFLSPKLSPMMKKVVNKVRTTPDQVLNAVRQGKSSTAIDKKEPKKWTWRCCICCPHAH